MAVTLYDPNRKAFVDLAPPDQMPMAELMLLNILIELQSISQVLKEQSPNLPASPMGTIRKDIVSN